VGEFRRADPRIVPLAEKSFKPLKSFTQTLRRSQFGRAWAAASLGYFSRQFRQSASMLSPND